MSLRSRSCVLVVLAVLALIAGGPGSASAAPPDPGPVQAGLAYTAITPHRLLDTRATHNPFAAYEERRMSTSAFVPVNTAAVVLNVTGLDATAPTYFTVAPSNISEPETSSLNVAAGETRANLVTVELATNRTQSHFLTLAAGNSGLDVIIDIEGYYAPPDRGGADYTALTPHRVMDTRADLGVAGRLGPHGTKTLDLSPFVPTGATAVTFNLTAVNATAATFVTAWAAGDARPAVSDLNTTPRATTPNLVTIGVGPSRKINLFNANGSVDVLADLAGYYSPASAGAFFPIAPLRLLDTRNANGTPREPIGPGHTHVLPLGGFLPAGATAAVFDLAGSNITGDTYLTAWPTGTRRPVVSNLNLRPGQTSAVTAIARTGAGTGVSLFNHVGNADVIVDLAGYFAPAPPPCVTGCAYAIGADDSGQLGNGIIDFNPYAPTPVLGLSDVVQVIVTGTNGYALKADGTVWDWGDNGVGQLAGGSPAGHTDAPGTARDFISPVPVRVRGLSHVVAIAEGMALKADGTVWTWGRNDDFRLGDGSTDSSRVATRAVRVSGLRGVTQIAGQFDNGFALRGDGTVWAWGDNVTGELGDGTHGAASAVPVEVSGLTGVNLIGPTVAQTSDGTVWTWGSMADFSEKDSPVRLPGVTGVVQFATASFLGRNGDTQAYTRYALLSDGTVRAWGDNQDGALGDGQHCGGGVCATPVTVSGLTNVRHIAGAQSTGYAVTTDGTTWAWGSGFEGQLGDANWSGDTAIPVTIARMPAAAGIGTGGAGIIPRV